MTNVTCSYGRTLLLLASLSSAASAAATLGFAQAHAQESVLGDRLVVSINNVPYSQRQVETYINIKESLRKADGPSRVVDASNWRDALSVFQEDMIILQEAQRLGSFHGADQALARYDAVVKAQIQSNSDLRQALARLGADTLSVGRTLENVLRVAAFRRSKDKQEEVKGEREALGQAKATRWLPELLERAVTRLFKDADAYRVIQPAVGKPLDGI